MTEENQRFRQEEKTRGQGRASTVSMPWSRTCLTELDDLGGVLRTAESNKIVEPSLEVWVRFSERLMSRILESSRHRPKASQRRQTLFDRYTASDSRGLALLRSLGRFLEENKRVALGLLLLATLCALAYLVL